VNIGGVNGHIIYEINNNMKIKRKIFLKHLALNLVYEQLKICLQVQQVQQTAKNVYTKYLRQMVNKRQLCLKKDYQKGATIVKEKKLGKLHINATYVKNVLW